MFINQIEIDGFKCYQEKVILKNIDQNFTAITGMNGSGKSNIIDAILFVLDLNTAKSMRASNLKDLININRKSAEVKIKLKNVKNYGDIEISRFIDKDNNKYKLNNQLCKKSTIDRIIKNSNISSNNIIKQGTIMKILNTKNNDLVSLIEEMGGIKNYNLEKKKNIEILQKKEFKLKTTQNYLEMKISPFFQKMKKEKEIYEKNKEIEENKSKNNNLFTKLNILNNKNIQKMKIIKTNEILINFFKEKDSLEKINIKINNLIKNKDIKNKLKIEEEIESLQAQIDQVKICKNLSEENFLQILNYLGEPLCDKKEKSEFLTQIFDKLKIKEKILKSNFDQNYSKINEKENLKNKICNEKIKIDEFNEEKTLNFIKNINIEIKDINNVENIKNINNDFLINLKTNFNNIYLNFINFLNLIKNIEEDLNKVKKTKDEYENLKSKFNYPFIKDFFGTVDENYTIKDKKYEMAINTILGNRNKFIIVKDENTGTKLLKETKRKISVIPLNKIEPFSESNLGNLRAVDCINFDPVFKNVFNFFLSNFYIFENKREAQDFCYKNKKLCVLLDGTLYDFRGTLTGGQNKYKNEIYKKNDLFKIKEEILNIYKKYFKNNEELNYDSLISYRDELNFNLKKFIKLFNIKFNLIDLNNKLNYLNDIENIDITDELNKINNIKNLSLIQNNKNRIHALKENLENYNENENLEDLDEKKEKQLKKTLTLENIIKKEYENILKISDFEDFKESEVSEYKEYFRLAELKKESNFNIFTFEGKIEKIPEIKEMMENKNCYFKFENDFMLIEGFESILMKIKKKISTAKINVSMNPQNFLFLEKNFSVIKEIEDKIRKLENDKVKILESIDKLNLLSNNEFKKAYDFLNEKLSSFLNYFIKDSEILVDRDFKLIIRLNRKLKTLDELSGGQRSIIALCLIFSMLKFQKCPFYIFDEIDSALDLKFTQFIPEILKREFESHQFLVVSLKNNFYENANKIFKVYIEGFRSKVKEIKC